jgi:hypothetical protein
VPICLSTDAVTNTWRFAGVNYNGDQIPSFVNGSPSGIYSRNTAFAALANGKPQVVSMINMYTTSATDMIFGASTASALYRMSGWWTDVIVIRGTIGDYMRQLVEGYLAWSCSQYGDTSLISNLISTHPFKNRPPLIGD